jgi:hypothetical protein
MESEIKKEQQVSRDATQREGRPWGKKTEMELWQDRHGRNGAVVTRPTYSKNVLRKGLPSDKKPLLGASKLRVFKLLTLHSELPTVP